MHDKLQVLVNKNPAGSLIREEDEYIFSYSDTTQENFISLTMPVRQKDYIHQQLHPIFEMHLPEGYLLSIIKKHFAKITKVDDMGLLTLMSKSISGRVTYTDETENQAEPLTLDTLIHPNSTALFSELVTRFALQSALSGVQPKILAQVQDKATLRLEQYIVKSWGDDYPQLSLNEYYCMRVAALSGLDVPEFYLSDDDRLFIMKRFDILSSGEMLGFEDMCVLQAKQSEDKYTGTYESVAKTIKTFVSPKHKKASLKAFFKMLVINTLVQNGDAHLKNFGLIYDDIENIRLAPTYDIVSTSVYIQNDIAALNLMGSKKWWPKEHLLKFATQSCDLSNIEAKESYAVCLSSLKKITKEIQVRLSSEEHPDKREVLTKLITTFRNSEAF